jgi:TorA maturation chaperone TorD
MELEFMYYLVAKQTQATKEGNLQDIQLYQQKQKTFLCSHLARWLPEFAKNVRENAQTEFYRKLTQLTEIFVQKDMDTCSLGGTRPTDLIRTR